MLRRFLLNNDGGIFFTKTDDLEQRIEDMVALGYSQPEVREYVLATIRELTELYSLDGLELDWMRFPRHLSGSPAEVWQKRDVLTGFTADVRRVLDGTGRRMSLSARIPTSLASCRRLGLDIAEWARQGLVDWLVPAAFLTTDLAIPIREFGAALGRHRVPLYASIELLHGTQVHGPESLRAAALSLSDCGADGIYLFNFPCWSEVLAAPPYHWLAGLHEPELAAEKPLLFSIPHTHCRLASVDTPGVLPLPLAPGQSEVLTLHIPAAALPAKAGLFLVHSGGDVALSLNSRQLPELPSLRRSELFVDYVDRGAMTPDGRAYDPGEDTRPRHEECRTFRVEPSWLQAGANRAAVANCSGSHLSVRRVNLGLW